MHLSCLSVLSVPTADVNRLQFKQRIAVNKTNLYEQKYSIYCQILNGFSTVLQYFIVHIRIQVILIVFFCNKIKHSTVDRSYCQMIIFYRWSGSRMWIVNCHSNCFNWSSSNFYGPEKECIEWFEKYGKLTYFPWI